VCTAEQQKEAYEVEKKSVFWLPKLCEACVANGEAGGSEAASA
jgi:hypothetical protein